MARSKQATPVRREPSSEYVSKYDRSPSNGKPNGKPDASQLAAAPATPAKKDAGVVTLIIDVAGIYASLYDAPFSSNTARAQC